MQLLKLLIPVKLVVTRKLRPIRAEYIISFFFYIIVRSIFNEFFFSLMVVSTFKMLCTKKVLRMGTFLEFEWRGIGKMLFGSFVSDEAKESLVVTFCEASP